MSRQITSKTAGLSKSFADINMGFTKNPFTGDISNVKNENAIKQSLRNIILTKRTEKLFDPQFGTNIWNTLFEPLDAITADRIEQEITATINQYERRITMTRVEVVPYFRDNCYHIFIEYRIIGSPLTETVSFVLERPS